MKATLIDFKKTVLDVARWEPVLKRREYQGLSTPDFKGDAVDPNYWGGGVTKEYELVSLHTVDRLGRRVTNRYFVNREDVQTAFPIVQTMVRAITKELHERHDEDLLRIAHLEDRIKLLKRPWYKKLWSKIKS